MIGSARHDGSIRLTAADIDGARIALAGPRLRGGNADVAERWLQLWQNGLPPSLAGLDAHPLPSHAPAMAVFRVRRGAALDCIRAGDYCRLAIGFDLNGQSVLSITNNVARDERLEWCWRIVEGAATVSYRAFKSADGAAVQAQGSDWVEGSVSGDLQTPPQRAMRSFAAPTTDMAVEMAGAELF